MSSTIRLALLAAFGAALAGPAAAQTSGTDTVPAPTERVCTDEATGAPKPCDTLSEHLNATGGVIAPPEGMDPEITAPAPDPNPGTTPVIPPSAVPTDPQSEPPVAPQ